MTDSNTWGSYDSAIADAETGRADGVGFVFASGGGLFGIDLDDCRDPQTGVVEGWAQDIVERFTTYAEVSPSGTGVHLIGRGKVPDRGNRVNHIEVYDRARFFTVTGNVLSGYDRIQDVQSELSAWHAEVFGRGESGSEQAAAPRPFLESTSAILKKLREEPDGEGVRLLEGDWGKYPSPSEARWRLAHKALFYTGDPDVVFDVLLMSNLFDGGENEVERERRARHDADKAARGYVGQRYDPNFRAAERSAAVRPVDVAPDLAWAVLANAGLSTGHRLTAFALISDLADRIARGEQPKDAGFRTPAARYAQMTGQAERTVAKHLRELDDRGLLTKNLVRTTTVRTDLLEITDGHTGEIRTESEQVRGTRDANFVSLLDDGLAGLAARLAAYPDSPASAGSGTSRTVKTSTGRVAATDMEEANTLPVAAPPTTERSGAYEIPLLPVLNSGISETPEHSSRAR